MKATLIKSSLLVAISITFFLVSGSATPENTGIPSPVLQTQPPTSSEVSQPLLKARQQLEKAHEYYQSGDITKVHESLQFASQSLQGHQANDETMQLANEIEQLQEQINSPSEGHDGTISRLWHRSSVLVEREVEGALKSWNDALLANKISKHIIDARMHFRYAEYDLFVIHDAEKARYEIESTLAYLDKANEISYPAVREKITQLKKDILLLPTKQANTEETQLIKQALKVAGASIDKVSQSLSPSIQSRSKKISIDIKSLEEDLFLLEKRQEYDSVMQRLHQLDDLL